MSPHADRTECSTSMTSQPSDGLGLLLPGEGPTSKHCSMMLWNEAALEIVYCAHATHAFQHAPLVGPTASLQKPCSLRPHMARCPLAAAGQPRWYLLETSTVAGLDAHLKGIKGLLCSKNIPPMRSVQDVLQVFIRPAAQSQQVCAWEGLRYVQHAYGCNLATHLIRSVRAPAA